MRIPSSPCGSCAALAAQVPLYPPTTVYLQLMAETRSRINACAEGTGTGVRCCCRCYYRCVRIEALSFSRGIEEIYEVR